MSLVAPRNPLKWRLRPCMLIAVLTTPRTSTIKPQPEAINTGFPPTNSRAVKKLQPVHPRNCVPDEIRRLQIAFMTFYIFPRRSQCRHALSKPVRMRHLKRVKRELLPFFSAIAEPSDGTFVSSNIPLTFRAPVLTEPWCLNPAASCSRDIICIHTGNRKVCQQFEIKQALKGTR